MRTRQRATKRDWHFLFPSSFLPPILFFAACCGPAAPALLGEKTASARLPVPTEAQRASALSQVRQLFKSQYADRTPAARVGLAKELRQGADESAADPAAEFVMLRESRDLFAREGQVRDAVLVARRMEQRFAIGLSSAEVDAIIAAHGTARTPETSVAVANSALAVTDWALRNSNAEGAARAIREAEAAVRGSDSSLGIRVAAAGKRVRAAQHRIEAMKTARQKLATTPDDREANLSIGRMLCEQGDWEHGLPLVERGADPALRSLIAHDLQNPVDSAQCAALADAWWGLPEKSGIGKPLAQLRAAHWYGLAVGQLIGLRRAEAIHRIDDADEAVAAEMPGIDLLARIDPRNDTVTGNWMMAEDGLVVRPGFYSHLQIPYHPPEEYDLHVAFARISGNWVVDEFCTVNNTQFAWEAGYEHDTGFAVALVDGPHLPNRHLVYPDARLINGRKYLTVISVRKHRVLVSVDGKAIADFDPNDYHLSLDTPFALPDPRSLGVANHQSGAVFFSIDLFEVSGPGQFVDDSVPVAATRSTTRPAS